MKHFIPIALIFLMACSTASQTGSSRREDPNPRPAWMSAKPNNPAYFAGIGYASKLAANNYMQVAKKNALEDLVSEIKINVSATSVLTQIDRGKEFSDQYESIIQTSVADEIEEYELVGAWEDKEAYWVYYRLSKARYNEIKDQQRRNAVALSLDFFGRAKQAERTGDAIGALSFYFKAFNSLEKYLAEAIRANFEGTDVL
ncbi:MAG TPA: LPP20 family lipoprotein, partial [Cyclobacteriaceae bacterium]|nr:LPP20 family lipoprotein [Cyclobacteriaceae bacterium]